MKNTVIIVLIGIFMTMGAIGCSSGINMPTQEEKKQINSSPMEEASPVVEIEGNLYAEEIQEGVYVINHEFPWPGNSMVVEMQSGDIVLVDTPYTPEATEELLNWINKHFGERKLLAINTGFHFDNLGGNQVLVQKDVPIYGSSMTEQLIYEAGEASRELMLSWLNTPESKAFYEAYQKIPYVPPTELFDLAETDLLYFKFGSEEIEVYYPGESHSPDNLVVYFPERNILFGGCMIKSLESKDLGNVADANLQEWPNSVKKVLDRYRDAKVVIPGHGKWGNIDLMKFTLQLCEEKN